MPSCEEIWQWFAHYGLGWGVFVMAHTKEDELECWRDEKSFASAKTCDSRSSRETLLKGES
jgi:hypothetical protein